MYWYWNSFNQPNNPQNCLSFATTSFGNHGLNVWGSGDYVTFAGAQDGSVAVQVTCAPQGNGSWVVVSAYSDDNNLAQTTQSNVASDVQNMTAID